MPPLVQTLSNQKWAVCDGLFTSIPAYSNTLSLIEVGNILIWAWNNVLSSSSMINDWLLTVNVSTLILSSSPIKNLSESLDKYSQKTLTSLIFANDVTVIINWRSDPPGPRLPIACIIPEYFSFNVIGLEYLSYLLNARR